jgi:hypothetical protein
MMTCNFLKILKVPLSLFVLELATLTNSLVKEMASGLVRIALECERTLFIFLGPPMRDSIPVLALIPC